MTEPLQTAVAKEPSGGRLHATLEGLDYCISRAESEEGITLGSVMDHLGPSSFCFVSILLATPFLQPMSLGPFTMASGGVFMLVGWQMARGKEHVALPSKVNAWQIRGKTWLGVLKICRKILLWVSRFTKSRLSSWVDGPQGTKNVGWLILVGGFLLAVPTANLPLNNTLPAFMIFFAAVAWLERDGLMAVISIFWGVLTLLYFALTASIALVLMGKFWAWMQSLF